MAAFVLVLLLRYPLNTALTVSASLAQIGVAAMDMQLKLLSAEGQSFILAGAIISIAINPLLFKAIEPLQRWIRAKSDLARRMERAEDPLAELPVSTDHAKLSGQVVLVGYGRVGKLIAQELETARALNPAIRTVVRTHHSQGEADLLRSEKAGKVFVGEQELAASMSQYVLANLRVPAAPPH